MTKKLLLFDIDGTILTMKGTLSKEIFREFFYQYFKVKIEIASFPSFSGKTDLQIIYDLLVVAGKENDFNKLNFNEIWIELDKYFEEYENSSFFDLHPGVNELILSLHDSSFFEISLLTGNYKQNAIRKISLFDFHNYIIEGAFGNDNIDRTKLPRIALDRFNKATHSSFSFENSIIIGDAPGDVNAAKSNGMKMLGVETGYYKSDELLRLGADSVVKDFSDTNKIIEILRNL